MLHINFAFVVDYNYAKFKLIHYAYSVHYLNSIVVCSILYLVPFSILSTHYVVCYTYKLNYIRLQHNTQYAVYCTLTKQYSLCSAQPMQILLINYIRSLHSELHLVNLYTHYAAYNHFDTHKLSTLLKLNLQYVLYILCSI